MPDLIHPLLSAPGLVGAIAAALMASLQFRIFIRCEREMTLHEHLRDVAQQVRFAALLGSSLAVLVGIEQHSVGAGLSLAFGYLYGWLLTYGALAVWVSKHGLPRR